MAAPDPYEFTDEFFDPALHWGLAPATGEKVGGYDPAGDNFFSRESGEASIVGLVDSARIRGFLRYCLGYNNMTTSATYFLQRTNPITHPRFTNLVCTGVSHRSFRPIRSDAPIGSENSGLKIPKNDDTSGAVCSPEPGGGSTPSAEAHTVPFYTGYEKELVTVRFGPAQYRYMPDNAITKEYQRNTIIDTEPRTEVLTLSGFQLIYAEGTGNTGNTSNPAGPPAAAAPTEVGQVLIKPDVVVKWFNVPEKFLSQNIIPGQVRPTKILAGLGTLNKTSWLSYEKGTLLFSGARLVRKPWVLAAGGSANDSPAANERESIFNYDVEFLMTYFNPTKGYASDVQITDSDTFGHNCLPWRGATPGTVLAGTDVNQGRWFFATYSGLKTGIGTDTGDQGQYRYSEYDNLFDTPWNP